MNGKVKWYNRKKGYGFIIGSDEQEYFVHYSQLPPQTVLHDDETVEFEPADTERGRQAQNVQISSAQESSDE